MKVLIADDHTIVREGLKRILLEAFPFCEIHDVSDAANLLKKAFSEKWDIIISDISMPGQSGIEVLKQIKEHAPLVPVLILSMHSPEQYAVRSIKAGASGYLTKESAPFELVNAVEKILGGKKYITPQVAEILAESIEQNVDKPPHEILSDREFEVLKLLASGQSISKIGEALSLSVNTISTYRARIMEKLNIHNNANLVKYAMKQGLI
ncbi:MAG: response regulator transcription factor [Bacteroidetes bacterium]|nr:response regulator transcription factor [Bacteroidota bacterium]